MRYSFIILTLLFTSQTFCQRIDFSSISIYHQIIQNLSKDIPINDADWNELLNNKGVKLYLNNQKADTSATNSYRRILEIVFMPKNRKTLNERLNTKDKFYLTKKIYPYLVLKDSIEAFVGSIETNPEKYMSELYNIANNYLPKRMHQKATESIFYIIPLYDDAVATEKDVIISSYGLYLSDKVAYGTLGGHELHHLLRKNLAQKNEKDKYLFEAISNVLNEGIPDLIDKKASDKPEYPPSMNYYELMMTNGRTQIPKMDSLICAYDTISNKSKDLIWKLSPMSGHIPGCFMAYIIQRNGFLDKVIKYADNPIIFFEQYNKAAKIDIEKPPIFSEKSIKRLRQIKLKKNGT